MNLVAHLLAMRVGVRVTASNAIWYPGEGVKIEKGSQGLVRGATCAGALLAVQWDGRTDHLWTHYSSVREIAPS